MMEINENLIISKDESLASMAKKINANAVKKGFWDGEFDVYEKTNLLHSEVSELLEEYRLEEPKELYFQEYDVLYKNEGLINSILDKYKKNDFRLVILNCKPCGYGIELADLLIRLLDMVEGLKIDIDYSKIDNTCFDYDISIQEIISDIHECITDVKEELINQEYYSYLPDLFDNIFSFAKLRGIDLMRMVEIKHKYNLTRRAKHGKRF